MQGLDLDRGVLGEDVQSFHAPGLNAVEPARAGVVPAAEHLVDLADIFKVPDPCLELLDPGLQGGTAFVCHECPPCDRLRLEVQPASGLPLPAAVPGEPPESLSEPTSQTECRSKCTETLEPVSRRTLGGTAVSTLVAAG